MSQKRNSFDKESLKKIGKGALIAGGGALLFYFLETLPKLDFGSEITPIVTAICAILINAIREYRRGDVRE